MQTNVYLAGGMNHGWREEVMERVQGAIYFDPTYNGLTSEKEYTAWDLDAIDRSDIVFAYMEENNPSGIGTATEVGYAVAKGKYVIYVQDVNLQASRKPYFGMIRAMARFITQRFDVGIEHLALKVAERNNQ